LETRSLTAIALLAALLLAGCANDTGAPTPTTTTGATPVVTPSPVAGTARSDDFENATVGELPAGWRVVAGEWSVVENASAPSGGKVLLSAQTQLGETLILDESAGNWSDLDARVMFNVQAGEKGQAGGIVFRHEDEKNYYVVRYNHNELSWNLFRTVDGNREKFAGTDESADAFHGALHTWTELRLEARGDHIQVWSGAVKVIDYTEEMDGAPASGGVGLWTRYDSKTEFDAFRVAAS
jgi:hypothetical protein